MSVGPVPEAASILLARGRASHEVYLVRRADNLRFFGGFHAFPGGRVDGADAALAGELPGLTGPHVAAVRELFEETGVLLARSASGEYPASPDLADRRRNLLDGRLPFRELLAQGELSLHAGDLSFAGSLVTPPFSPIRFDTRFFTASLPPNQEPALWPGELAEGDWLSAAAALDGWARGERLVAPPTVTLLQAIRGAPIAGLADRLQPLLARLAAGELAPISFAPDVDMLPLHCDGLPPSTHTNAFLIGRDPAYLFDPAPTDPAEQRRLFAALDGHRAAGRRLAGIVLSHHHPDHIGAATACAARYQAPILAHAATARLLEGKVAVNRLLADGAWLDLGLTVDGSPWRLEVVLTPGHAPGHLVFYDPYYRFLFAGDMVSTLSSVVIPPPEGDLALYLASLRRLQTVPARLLLPAHGAPTARVAAVLADCLEHRHQREMQLMAALSTTARTVAELVQVLYRGLPSGLLQFAELQTLAGLHKLEKEGRVACAGEGWRRLDESSPGNVAEAAPREAP